MKARSLTLHERILDLIATSVRDRGYPPSMRELGKAVGMTSPSSVIYQLRLMELRGLIERDPNLPRAIRIVNREAS